nr:unnamed protein product [Digitaria exilis]
MTTYTAAPSNACSSPSNLTDPYLGYIGNAVGDAVEHGNTDLLEFVIYRDVNNDLISYEHCVVFGQRFMSFVQACPVAFRWLTRLVLHDLAFGDSHGSTVLSSCRKLEHLSLNECVCEVDHVTGEDTVLTIDAPNSSLLGLEIITCAYAGINLVQAPKLGRLRCKDWLGADPPFRFGKVPCLDSIVLECSALHGQNPLGRGARCCCA